MIQKLNLNTPDDDLAETIDYEVERATRWYEKKKRDIDSEKYKLYSKACGNNINVATTPVEWVSPQTDNHWIIFEVGIPLQDKTGMRWFPIELCYYETIGSIGAFAYLDIHQDDKLLRRTYLIFSSHFFLRYRKRMNLTHEGKDLLQYFFMHNPEMELHIHEDIGQFYKHKGQNCMNAIYEDGVAYCKLHKGNEVVEVATFLPHEEISLSERHRLADMYHSFNPEQYKSKNQLEMTKTILQTFGRCLKANGLKTKFENMCNEAHDVIYNQYLDLAEPIYIISRVQHTAKDLDKVKTCNKQWIFHVIDNDWQPQLRPYIEKYGQQLVSNAIDYLIDNDLWQSPKGSAALRVHKADHWDGLKAIDDTVAYLIEQDPNLSDFLPENIAKREAEEAQMQEEEEQFPTDGEMIDPCDQSQEQDEPITPNDIAMAIATDMATAMKQVKEKLDTLNATIASNKELAELNKTKAEVANLTRQLEQKTKDLDKWKADYQGAQTRYNNKCQEYATLKKEHDNCYDLYKDEKARSEALEEKVAELQKQVDEKPESIPTKRVFTYSEIKAVPLIGDTIIQSLDKFFFTKKGIVIDYNK